MNTDRTLRGYRAWFVIAYLVAVTGLSVTVTRPEFAALSLTGAVCAGCVFRGRKAAVFAIAFCLPAAVIAALVNPMVNHLGVTVLFYLFSNPVTAEAFYYGVAAGSVFAAVIMWFYAFRSVMTGENFAAAAGRAMPKTALTLRIALGCEPALRSDIREISDARAMLGEKRNLRHGLKTLDAAVGCALEDSVETAAQLRARGFGLRPRTDYGAAKGGTVFFTVAAVAFAVTAAARVFSGAYFYYPVFTMPYGAADIVSAVAFGALCFLPAATGAYGKLKWRLSKSKI